MLKKSMMMQKSLSLTVFVLFIFCILCSIPAYSVEVAIKGPINDYTGTLSSEDKQKIESVLQSISTKANMAIVIVESTEGMDFDSYAISLAQQMGSAQNNILLFVSMKDKRYKIIAGSALKNELTDNLLNGIEKNVLLENFRKDEYGKGIYDACVEIQNILSENATDENATDNFYISPLWIALILFTVFIIFTILGHETTMNYYKRKDKYFDAALMASRMIKEK